MSDGEWMTTAEVAEVLGCRVGTVHQMLSRGQLLTIERIPGHGKTPSLFLRSDFEAEMARRAKAKDRSHAYSWER